MPTVSICLPVYNGSKFLAKALDSAIGQTYQDFEILIGNNCSTDGTQAIIDSYTEKDERIKGWINEKNLMVFGNYNRCIDRASGKYIKLFAHDDLFHPTLLARMVDVLEKNADVSLVACARKWIDADDNVIEAESAAAAKIMKPFPQDTQITAAQAITQTLLDVMNWLGEPCSQMFRRTDANGGYDVSFKQIGDLEYAYRLLQNGDYYFLAEDLCYFRRHAESWSQARSFDLSAYLDWFLLAAKYQKYLVDAEIDLNQYCLTLVRALTQNVEYEMQSAGRTTEEERLKLMHELLAMAPLSFFQYEKDQRRDLPTELGGMAVPAFVRCVALEADLSLQRKEAKKMSLESSAANRAAHEAKQGLTQEIESLKKSVEQKDKEISELRTLLDDMGSSVSWKVTAPLRKIKSRLR